MTNAAVVWPLAATATIDPDEWAAAIAINVLGPARLTIALLPAMLEQGWGRIVNLSARIASEPAALIRGNAYAASKAALEAHTLNLAADWSAPASLSTPSAQASWTPPRKHGSAANPAKRSVRNSTSGSQAPTSKAR